MAYIPAAQIRAEQRAFRLQQEAEALFAKREVLRDAQACAFAPRDERGGARPAEAPACAGAHGAQPGECRALVVVRPRIGAGFAKNPPLLFRGGDRGVVPDAEASGDVSHNGHHPQTPSSEEEGASGGAQPTPERRTVFLPELKSRFLEHLAEFGNVGLACKRAGVSRQTAYRERRRAPAFARLWDAAMIAARTVAEEALAERAVHGVEEPVFYHGEEVGHRRRYSDRLLLAHLARLDKVEAKPELEAALAGLDDAIEALGRGEELGEEIPCVPA